MNTIFEHRSIRKFKSDVIPIDIMNRVLEAGSRASTTGNMQVYSIIVSTDPAIKKQLLPCHFNQAMVIEAPAVLTFCADFNRFNLWCELNNAKPGYDNFLSFVTAAIDALLASQNVALEAEANKLGICYLGTTTYMADKIIDILNLPLGVVPITTLALGYPDENPPLTDRLPMDAIIHWETYQPFTPEKIKSIYFERENNELTKKLLLENNKETLAQIFTDNRYKKQDNVLFSNKFLDVIRKQGFMNNE